MGRLLETGSVRWWKWLLLSLGVITGTAVALLVGILALAYHGVDVREYLYVARPAWITSGWTGFWLAFLIMVQSLAAVVGLALFRPVRPAAFAGLRRPVEWQGALRRLLAGGCLAVGVQWLWALVGPDPAGPYRLVESVVYAVSRGGALWPWVWLLAAAVAVAPFAEEVLYRGLIQSGLRRRWGVRAGMAGSALLFGLSHGPANALPAALLGLYFSYQVEQDRSLVGAIALHALHNVAAVLIMAAA
ncbi:MAG: CPBP family intramembrane glutamic endopeptidase [Bacillota bacterium]